MFRLFSLNLIEHAINCTLLCRSQEPYMPQHVYLQCIPARWNVKLTLSTRKLLSRKPGCLPDKRRQQCFYLRTFCFAIQTLTWYIWLYSHFQPVIRDLNIFLMVFRVGADTTYLGGVCFNNR